MKPIPTRQLDFDTETVTIRELIRRRVYEECVEYNSGHQERFRGLVIPEGMERELNTPTVPRPRKIDWEKQYARAQEAFQRNGIIVLVVDEQADNLEETVTLKLGEPLEVTFLKLVPLVGG
ncbi:hypothetical protein D3875_16300 [Deinococcus cavernae]|uniref:Uncharacterized protein n=1 Tax=Deinococcus cavernae TaxID=2320857 RepID=A0A418V9W5_9DEIO|nr:hypothetical protein D3875_16300 [Deinococcus cavernae]